MAAVAITALLAAALALAWHLRPRMPMPGGVMLVLVSYALMGSWALWFGVLSPATPEPAWIIFWKPTILYWSIALILLIAPILHWGYPAKAVIGTYFVFSNAEWRWINRGFAAFLLVLGGLNMYIAITGTVSEWEGFKWSSTVNLIAIFILRVTFHWIDTLVRAAVYLHGRAKAYFQ